MEGSSRLQSLYEKIPQSHGYNTFSARIGRYKSFEEIYIGRKYKT